ncbi:MAG: 8-oxo-dGTP pyrophosphatase MutT (NUDIX family) [Flavobacteriales bacterium]|jgi:8-oxo-dGTP pyrophosphatase MutT (NUDIX family)
MLDFFKKLENILSEELPSGLDNHMSPSFRSKPKKEWINAQNPRIASVMILLYPKDQQIHIAFTKRHDYQGVHGNQISLPGGKREDADTDLLATALRETREEIGVQPDKIIGNLSEIYIPPSNFIVQPYVGYSLTQPQFIIEKHEVASLLEIPLLSFIDPINQQTVEINVRGREMSVPAYIWKDEIIWGATAMILAEFIAYVKNVYKPFNN